MNYRYTCALGLVFLLAMHSQVLSSDTLKAFPEEVQLSYSNDHQKLVVQVLHSDGSTQDVSSEVRLVDSTAPIRLSSGRIEIDPTKDNEKFSDFPNFLHLEYRGKTLEVPFHLHKAETRPLTFRNDILAVLTKAGCNSGKCHGSASGKDGFRLSLYGFDPEGDYFRITKEMSGRRISLTSPESCLLMDKATGEVPHTGGDLIAKDSTEYLQLARWLLQSAPEDSESTPLPTGIRVMPSKSVLAKAGASQDLVVVASYDDGSVRDVTKYAVFLSNNDAVAGVSGDGRVTTTGPGNAHVLARFDQFTANTEIIVRPGGKYQGLDFEPYNYIDELVAKRWTDLHLQPSTIASDEAFLRRVYLDLTGQLPSSDARSQFLASDNPQKREALVDELVNSPDFLDLWAMKLAEMLQIRRANGLSEKGLKSYDAWLRKQVHSGVGVDQIVRKLIPASGSTFDNPATCYYQTETTPQLLAENIAQAFLGTRIQCAQCHNHPFDRWTMDDYYGFASFVSQVGYKQAKDPREITVYDLGEGNLEHPVAGREVVPKYLGGEYIHGDTDPTDDDLRELLASWLTDGSNQAFSNNIGNVLWHHFFGVGIVNPVDDVRVSNPPSNVALWNALGEKLVDYEFDVRRLARDICVSKTYQLSTQKNVSNQWDDRNFSSQSIRRLTAEVLLDVLSQVTDTSDRLGGLPLGGRAIQVPDADSDSYFLDTFGRSTRETPCSCEVSTSPTLSQALHLLNGENTTGKIAEGGVVAELQQKYSDPVTVANQLYIRCFSRELTAEERSAVKEMLASSTDLEQDLKDLFWALLNSNEFIFNH